MTHLQENEHTAFNLSPPVVLQTRNVGRKRLHIAREDFLEGGTKQRAIIPYLQELQSRGFRHVVYASPFCGFAQVALAACGARLNLKVILFCEKDQTAKDSTVQLHTFSKLAESFGALIQFCDNLEQAEALSFEFTQGQKNTFKIPQRACS